MDTKLLEDMKQSSSDNLQFGEPKLTQTQQKHHDMLLNWLQGKVEAPFAVLRGFAGTGKSFTLNRVVASIKQTLRLSIGVTAPTHKAVKVLKRNAILNVEYRTIHSMLALKQVTDIHSGKISYKPDGKVDKPPPIASLKVLIHDETSMLPDELFQYIVPYIRNGLKVIFTGDPAQIPQIHGDRDSNGKAFVKPAIPFRNAENWKALVCELTQPMRQKDGNPILEFGTQLRSNLLQSNHLPAEMLIDGNLGIKLIEHNSQEEDDIMRKYFTSKEFTEDPDHFKVIAWRNDTVRDYNAIARGMIFSGETHLAFIMLGEKLVMDKPFIISNRTVVTTNEEVTVIEVVQGIKSIQYADAYGNSSEDIVNVYNVRVKFFTDDEESFARFPIPHESTLPLLKQILEKTKQYALDAPFNLKGNMWRQHYKIEEQFAWVTYNYAITAHKAQGSSYDSNLTLLWDITVNSNIEERNMILYVACTRARNTLYIET